MSQKAREDLAEIEVKFIIDDLAALRQRLMALGAVVKIPRTYEDNILFDTPEQRFLSQDCLLRLRHDQRYVLTYKEPPPTADADFKVRHEYEVEVSDGALMHAMLEKLGFTPVWRYEKYRETYTYHDTEIVLDETPCGPFLEIEGARDAIRAIATTLGLDFADRITASYAEIFAAVCATYHLQCTDMTFDNFQALHIDVRACHLA
jgi:adenylate cyclase class 2